MAILSDVGIRWYLENERLVIEPLEASQIQPASVDLRLDNKFVTFSGLPQVIDPSRDTAVYDHHEVEWDDAFVMPPNGFVLASTVERVKFPSDLAGQVIDKSSLARLGLGLHAGFIDPGFQGYITLEITNHSGHAFRLYPGMLIGQLALGEMDGAVSALYGFQTGAHYQTQPRGPVPYRGHDRFRYGRPEGLE